MPSYLITCFLKKTKTRFITFRKVIISLTFHFVTDIRHSLRKATRTERILFINQLETSKGREVRENEESGLISHA